MLWKFIIKQFDLAVIYWKWYYHDYLKHILENSEKIYN